MAVRLHVAAARNTTEGELRAAVAGIFGDQIDQLEIQEGEGWHSLLASVWGVSGEDLDKALQTLDGPCLRATTMDGYLWYLLLFGAGQEPFTTCHVFGSLFRGEEEHFEDEFEEDRREALAFLEDEDAVPEEPDPVEATIAEYALYGCPIPEGLAEQMRGLGPEDAHQAMVQALAEQVEEALTRFGIPHDRDEVIAILTGESVTDEELEQDVGNLPRFLAALGLGEYWEQALAQQVETEDWEEDEAYPEEECQPQRHRTGGDEVLAIIEGLKHLEPVPIEGGAVHRAIEDFLDVAMLGILCGAIPRSVAWLRWPGEAPDVDWSLMGFLPVRLLEDGVQIGIDGLDFANLEMAAPYLILALGAMPEGTTLEFIIGHVRLLEPPDENLPGQRYLGTLEQGVWHIEQAWPEMTREELAGALELVDELNAEEGFLARDEEEADAIMAAAARHPSFLGNLPAREGLRISTEEWEMGELGALFFRQRFGDTWHLSGDIERDRERAEQMIAAEEAMTAPHSDEIIREGPLGRFWRADIRDLDDVEPVNPLLGLAGFLTPEAIAELSATLEPATAAEEAPEVPSVEEVDAEMAELDLHPLGDMVAEAAKGVVLRSYGAEGSPCWGVFMRGVQGEAVCEFYTRFADGSSLTTTTSEDADSDPDQGIFMRQYEDISLAGLHAKHRDGIKRFRKHRKTKPVGAQPDLAAVAAAIEEFLQRRSSGGIIEFEL